MRSRSLFRVLYATKFFDTMCFMSRYRISNYSSFNSIIENHKQRINIKANNAAK